MQATIASMSEILQWRIRPGGLAFCVWRDRFDRCCLCARLVTSPRAPSSFPTFRVSLFSSFVFGVAKQFFFRDMLELRSSAAED